MKKTKWIIRLKFTIELKQKNKIKNFELQKKVLFLYLRS